IYAVVLVGNFFQPHSMLLEAPPVLEQIELPWGEHITRATTRPAPWIKIFWMAHIFTIAYLIYACIGLFRRGPRQRAWAITLCTSLFFANLALTMMTRIGVLDFSYVPTPGFLALVIVMSVMLTRELRRSQTQMQALLDNVPAVTYLKNANGRYLFVNRRFEQVYEIAVGTAIGKTDAQLFPAQRAAQLAEVDRKLLASGATFESEEVIEKNGEARSYATLRFVLHDYVGRVYALCGIATDITERKSAADAVKSQAETLERRVARRTRELGQLNKELEAFAYSVSHDLRAPLTSVNGFAELLLREYGAKLDPTAARYLNRIRDGSLRMATLIQDLLGLSRVTQQPLQRQSTDLAVLAEESLKTLREADPTRKVVCVMPHTLPVNGDPKLLRLALNNLLTNAWKYTSKTAEPRLELGVVEEQAEHVYFVRDNGAGFNPEYADRLFRPFVRLHSDSEFPGTGIGLATVARIVARHGGRIWADGKPNGGATFFFTLPGDDDTPASHTATFVESLGS
ncbi:MAG TPA: ATP-binding protein, partial [Steroidobacteraceae bacterium]|nr:ATP-binding protein [Steroidobacteraceae bacterium]